MTQRSFHPALALLGLVATLGACNVTDDQVRQSQAAELPGPMRVHYLEIVTPDVHDMCKTLEELHGVSFGEPDLGFGNARKATLEDGRMIGVRAPMRDDEAPVVRPYVLVDDIEAAVEVARAAGAVIALPPMPIPGAGKFAVYIQGGIQHGFWQH